MLQNTMTNTVPLFLWHGEILSMGLTHPKDEEEGKSSTPHKSLQS